MKPSFVARLRDWFRRLLRRDRWDKRVVRDFARTFPGRCPICSYHRFGLQHGYAADAGLADHECSETRDQLDAVTRELAVDHHFREVEKKLRKKLGLEEAAE